MKGPQPVTPDKSLPMSIDEMYSASFYDVLGVLPGASTRMITQARKKYSFEIPLMSFVPVFLKAANMFVGFFDYVLAS